MGLVRDFVRHVRARWRLRKANDAVTDWCTTCGRPLTDRTRWTLTAEAPPTMEGGVLGGSYTAADYCKAHAPEGAVPAR